MGWFLNQDSTLLKTWSLWKFYQALAIRVGGYRCECWRWEKMIFYLLQFYDRQAIYGLSASSVCYRILEKICYVGICKSLLLHGVLIFHKINRMSLCSLLETSRNTFTKVHTPFNSLCRTNRTGLTGFACNFSSLSLVKTRSVIQK